MPTSRQFGEDRVGTRESKGPVMGGLRLADGSVSEGRRPTRTLRLRDAIVACGLIDFSGKCVLDVGCAEGIHSLYMSEAAAEVIGIDHRAKKIATAKSNAAALGKDNVKFYVGDVRDQSSFRQLGQFDIVVAWGFLHRISDIFSLLYTLAPLTNALSLEWRTPILPMMSALSVAYHDPAGEFLDPTNIGTERDAVDKLKLEGGSGFWEPTPGAVTAIVGRLGFEHATLIGYGDRFHSERTMVDGTRAKHLARADDGRVTIERLPRGRVHMLFEKQKGTIAVRERRDAKFPAWDVALQESLENSRARKKK